MVQEFGFSAALIHLSKVFPSKMVSKAVSLACAESEANRKMAMYFG